MTDSKPPQTFEELRRAAVLLGLPMATWAERTWARTLILNSGASIIELISRVASQQAEIERLWTTLRMEQAVHRADVEAHQPSGHLAEQFARCEAVVEAAQKYRKAEKRYNEGTLKERVPNNHLINEARAELDAALAALEEKR